MLPASLLTLFDGWPPLLAPSPALLPLAPLRTRRRLVAHCTCSARCCVPRWRAAQVRSARSGA